MCFPLGHVVNSRYMSGSSKVTTTKPPHVPKTSTSVTLRPPPLSSARKTRPPTVSECYFSGDIMP